MSFCSFCKLRIITHKTKLFQKGFEKCHFWLEEQPLATENRHSNREHFSSTLPKSYYWFLVFNQTTKSTTCIYQINDLCGNNSIAKDISINNEFMGFQFFTQCVLMFVSDVRIYKSWVSFLKANNISTQLSQDDILRMISSLFVDNLNVFNLFL